MLQQKSIVAANSIQVLFLQRSRIQIVIVQQVWQQIRPKGDAGNVLVSNYVKQISEIEI